MTTRYVPDLKLATLKAWLVNYPRQAAGQIADMEAVWWPFVTSNVWDHAPDPKTRDGFYAALVVLTGTDLQAREQLFWETYAPSAKP